MPISPPSSAKSIRVGVDGYNFAMPKGTGVATYGMNLARAARANGNWLEGIFGLDAGTEPAAREVSFFDQLERPRPARRSTIRMAALRSLGARKLQEVIMSGRIEWRPFEERMPVFDRIWTAPLLFEVAHWWFRTTGRFLSVSMAAPPDIMHWTYPVPLRAIGSRNIYTLHDLVPLKMPNATLDDKENYFRLVRRCVQTADRICTVSESSRRDILDTFDVPSARVVNTYQSSPIPEEVAASDSSEDARMISGLFSLESKSYFLFFGAKDPKKNLPRIIEAYLTSHSRSPLVIVGARDWGMAGEKNALGSGVKVYGHQAGGRIIQLDYMPRALLCRMIRNAKAVIFPSLYEGFGLPVVEAIQLGTPVITSTTSSLPEVAGDGGLLVDPYDVRAIAGAISQLDDDDQLLGRLRSAGLRHAERFSEAAYREALAGLYASTLHGER